MYDENSEKWKESWKRWRSLILTSEKLAEHAEGTAPLEIEVILDHLQALEELFPRSLDPVDDLEGYAIRKFCKAMKAALERAQDPKAPIN